MKQRIKSKHMGRKVLSWLLCAAMLIGMMPQLTLTARAEVQYADEGATAIVSDMTDFTAALNNTAVNKIVIAKDFTMTQVTFPSTFDRAITIDGLYNDEVHTLSQTGENNMFLLQNTAKVTLKNLTLDAATSSGPIVIGHNGAASDLLMENVTVKCTAGSSSYGTGLHVYNSTAAATVKNCIFDGTDRVQANCMIVNSGTIDVSGTEIKNASKGGVSNTGTATATFENCAFTGNTANLTGGAINNTGTMTAENCVFTGNTASSAGGAIYNTATAVLKNCFIAENASTSSGGGVGSANNTSKLILDGCSFTGNRAGNGGDSGSVTGGAVDVRNGGKLYANNTVFANNLADLSGGVYSYGGGTYLMNCTITGNIGRVSYYRTRGQGMDIQNSYTYVVNCLITNNYYGPTASESDINTTLAGNTANLIGRVGSSGDINYASGVAADYTANVSIDGNSYTVSVPALQAKKDTEYAKYVPVSAGGSAASGGVYATYFDYSDLSAIKMGYKVNENDAITALGNLTAPDAESAESNKVTTYFEGTARAAGVIGASGVVATQISTWSELYSALQAGGYYQLTADVKFGEGGGDYASSELVNAKNVTVSLDLNGHIIDRGFTESNSEKVLSVSGHMTLEDSAPNAEHDPAVTYIDPVTEQTVTVLGGVITGGAGFKVGAFDTGATCTMNGGTITGNISDDAAGINVDYGSFTMNGGAVAGNTNNGTSDYTYVGGVNSSSTGSLYINGGTITGNSARDVGGLRIGTSNYSIGSDGGEVIISNNVADESGTGGMVGCETFSGSLIVSGNKAGEKASNLYMGRWTNPQRQATLTIDDSFDSNTRIGITTWGTPTKGSPVVFTNGLSEKGTAANFTSDNSAYVVQLNDSGEAQLVWASTITLTAGDHMTRTPASGAATQTVIDNGSYTSVVYTADDGYYFPADYVSGITVAGGISVIRDDYTQITVSGTPTAATVEITLPAPTAKVQETKPAAVFTATGPDTGTLTNVSAGMTYQIGDGDAETISGTSVNLTGLSAGTIKVAQPAADETRLPSDVQEITVTKATTPTLTVTQPAVIDGKGGVTDSTNAHEYMYSADGETWTEWTACEGEMSGLDEGKYRIRVKASGNILASEYQEFTITAFVPDQETKPEGVSFTADGSDTGILSGLTPGEKYGVSGAGLDSAADSTKTADENGKITLTGLAAGTLSVVKKGNGTTTIDSDPFEITVDKAETPEELGKTDCTTVSDNDGTITGVTTAMEYRKSGSTAWTAVTEAGTIGGLASGTYYVRVRATGAALASGSVTLEITAYIPPTAYEVNVVNGTFDGEDHEAGETVTVTANAAPEGYEFDKWTSGDGVTFADEYATVTTFIMPARAVTVTAAYKITKTLPVVTLPTAKTGLTYTGSAMTLINAGSADGGTIKYAVTESGAAAPAADQYTAAVPERTNAGSYTIYYRVDSDGEHLDSDAAGSIEVRIAKAAHEDARISGGARFGLSETLQLAEFIELGATLGSISVSDESGVLSGTPVINGTALGFEMKDIPENAGKSAVITIPVKDMTNLADYELKITLTVAECKHEHTELRDAKAATCKEPGYTGDTWCTDCNRKIKAGEATPILTAHTYDNGVVTKQPTVITKGVITYTCQVCGHTYTETIPMLDDGEDRSNLIGDITDQTGDIDADSQTQEKADGSTETTITVGDQEVTTIVTDAEGETTMETKVWIGGLKSSYAYTGAAIKPEFHVYDGIKELTFGMDYTVSYKNNKNVGSAAVITVSFKGDYKSTPAEQVQFSITPAVLGTDVLVQDLAVVATGKAQKPAPAVVWAATGKPINKSNFTFTYRKAGDAAGAALESIKDAGEYIVTVTAKNQSFDGSVTAAIKATDDKKLMLSNASVTLNPKSYTYTGQAIVPAAGAYTLKLNGQTLTAGTDYEVSELHNNVNPGKATVIFTAINSNAAGYVGSKSATFTITKGRELKEADGFEYSYSGTVPYVKGGAKPAVKVTDNGRTLKAGTDYTVSYSKNTAVTDGKTAIITVKGKGNYKGSVKLTFAIAKQDISALAGNILAMDKVESKKGYQNPTVTITDTDGKALRAGKDFVIGDDYTEPDTDGKVTVSIQGAGNYTGSVKVTYRYIKASAQLGKVKANKLAVKVYTGSAVRLTDQELTAILYTGTKASPNYLIPGKDFEVVSYSNNKKSGTAKVTLRGIGAYGGTRTLTFKIGAKKGDYKGVLVDGIWK